MADSERRRGITVHMRVDRQNSTVDYPKATHAVVKPNGTLTLLGPGGREEILGDVAKGSWTHWTWTDDYTDGQDLD